MRRPAKRGGRFADARRWSISKNVVSPMNGRSSCDCVAPNRSPAAAWPASRARSASSSVRDRPLVTDGNSARKRSSASARKGSTGAPSLEAMRAASSCLVSSTSAVGSGARNARQAWLASSKWPAMTGTPVPTSVAELIGRQLSETDESIDAGERSNTDERTARGRGLLSRHQIQHADQLELIEQIVLEPQHDLASAPGPRPRSSRRPWRGRAGSRHTAERRHQRRETARAPRATRFPRPADTVPRAARPLRFRPGRARRV